jgi:hypothetical protein
MTVGLVQKDILLIVKNSVGPCLNNITSRGRIKQNSGWPWQE